MSIDQNVVNAYSNFLDQPFLHDFSEMKGSVQYENEKRKDYFETPTKASSNFGRRASYSMPHESKLVVSSSANVLPRIEAFSPQKKNKFFKVDRMSILQAVKKPDPKEIEREQQILKMLEGSSEVEKIDLKTNCTVGEQAVKGYYEHHRKLTKIKQQNEFYDIQDSIQTSMLKQVEKINVIPCKMGMVKESGSEASLQLNHQKFGDRYASVLSEGLKQSANIKEFLLKGNNLKSNGASQIISQIGKIAKVIDLESNQIGSLGTDTICQQIQLRDNKIEILNIEDNKLGDRNVQKILKAIINSHNQLRSINISKNYLTNQICSDISQLIQESSDIEELYLHWNQIKGSGGQKIFEALIENKNITVFDISWNSLGAAEKNPSWIVQKICDFLVTNKTVLHLDLSSNQFTINDSIVIAESLKKNRTIYGFHYDGNWGKVDARGFLEVADDEIQKKLGETPRIRGLEQVTHLRRENICWICEGWQEQTFEWNERNDNDPVFLHMDFEQYKSVYIPKEQQSLNLMVPGGFTHYFYTVVDSQQYAPDQQTIENKHLLNIEVMGNKIEVQIEKVNFIKKPKMYRVIDSTELKAVVSVLPRTPDPQYIPPKLKKQKRVWTFPISIWYRDFKFETEDLLRRCFEKDWACSKIMKIVKNPDELEEVKKLLWQHYKLIKESYKQYSSYNPIGDIWSIQINYVTEFAQQTELIDNKTLKLSDLDLKFIATTAASSTEFKGNFRNPERALCRFQFMEFLIRVAEDKYIKTKTANNMVEASKMLLQQCTPFMSTFDAQKWRNERYFNEQCDDCLKFYKNLLTNVYNRYSAKKVKPGQKKFMCLDELQDICSNCNLFDERFVERDANIAFNLSMMLQVDELEQDRIFQMTFIEFMEAVARIAEKSSPAAIGSEDLTWEQRVAQPLCYKLERLCVILANNCASEELKLQYGNRTKSMFKIVQEND